MAHPLRGRDFRLLFGARILSMPGDAAVPAALAIAVLRVTGSTSALALPLALLAVPASPVLIIGSYGLALTGLGVLNPTWGTVVQLTVPRHVLARVTSYDWLLSLAAAPLGYVLAPWAASAWGPSVPLVATAFLVGASCLGTAAVPGVRRLTMPAGHPPGTTPPPGTEPTR